MDETKSETRENPDWKPETWGGPRPGSGRPTLGGDEDPTVTVTVMMPLSLKEEAIRQGNGNMSWGIRKAITFVALFPSGSPSYENTGRGGREYYEVVDVRSREFDPLSVAE